MRRIVSKIKLVNYGDFYKWEIQSKHFDITTQGFNSITKGLKILKENITNWTPIKKENKGDKE